MSSRACVSRECQARRIDKANSLTVDDDTTHAAANQSIQPPTQRRHRGDVDIAWWRQNRLCHSTHSYDHGSPKAHLMHSVSQPYGFNPPSVVYERPRKTQGTPMQCHRPAPIR